MFAPGDAEGDAHDRHRGADPWLDVQSGTGGATVNGRRYPLRARTRMLIERKTSARVATADARRCAR